jgi:zinc protease
MLDLPETDADTLSTGMMLMRETASNLTLAQTAMDPERGVVLSEERLRSTPGYRAQKQLFDFLLTGQLVPHRFPIGQVSVLQTAPVSQIRRYYEANYRPDRATLIVVGDIDPADIEKRIKAGFSDWKGVGPETKAPDLGAVAQRGAGADLVVEPGAPTAISVNWVKPFDNSADTTATRRRDFAEEVGFAILNRRLEKLTRLDKPPFLGASGSDNNFLRSAQLTSIDATSQPDGWRAALDAIVHEQRSVVEFGVRKDEMERELSESRAVLQSAVAGASTRRTPQLANGLVSAASDDDVFTTPQENLDLFDGFAKTLTVDEVNAAMRKAFTGSGPLLAMTSPTPVEGGQKALEDEFAKARGETIAASTQSDVKTWPYTNFGPAGAVVDKHVDAASGATVVRFANGVRLTVKPTTFRKDQILVSAVIGGGRLDLPKDHTVPTWADRAFTEGAFADLDLNQLEQVLTGKIVSSQLALSDSAFVLEGRTRPQDFDLQMQLLTAYLAHPGWRSQPLDQLKTQIVTILPQVRSTPGGVLQLDLPSALHAGDPRWRPLPDAATISATKMDDVKSFLAPELAHGRIDVVVTGDVTVDQAIAAVGSTFAALPQRADAVTPAPGSQETHFPAPNATPQVLTHTGRADQAQAFVAWPTQDTYADVHESRVLSIAESILELRLIDQVRIAEGATYPPQAGINSSQLFKGYGYVSATVETPPEKIPGFYADVRKIAADMAAKGVTADEIERARKPLLERLDKEIQTNEFWQRTLVDAQSDARRMELFKSLVADLNSVTPDEVQKAAARFFVDGHAWRLQVTPQASATAATK